MSLPPRLEKFLIETCDLVFAVTPQKLPKRKLLEECRIVSHRGIHDNLQSKENTLEAFVKGCKQICAGIGFTKETPIEGLNIPQGNDLARLFHFEVSSYEIAEMESGNWITDKVLWKHLITDNEITIYIWVILGEAGRLP